MTHHEIFGEDLAGFELSSGPGWTEQGQPGRRKPVSYPAAQGELGSYNGHVGLFSLGQGQCLSGIAEIRRDTSGQPGDAHISGRADNFSHITLGSEFPDQGMFPAAAAKDQHVHEDPTKRFDEKQLLRTAVSHEPINRASSPFPR